MILILGGTTESKQIAENIKEDFFISVATSYGKEDFEYLKDRVVNIVFDKKSLEEFVIKNNIDRIIDATHPYAFEISNIAKEVSKKLGIKYISRKRKLIEKNQINYKKAYFFEDYQKFKEFLKGFSSILFTIGSKHLCVFKEFKDVAYFRVLPDIESIKRCKSCGIKGSRIIAMQGVFSVEFNVAMFKELKIDCVVSKNSSMAGGLMNKIEAAYKTDISIAILQPEFFQKNLHHIANSQ